MPVRTEPPAGARSGVNRPRRRRARPRHGRARSRRRLVSARKPSASARRVSKSRAQPATMRVMVGSGSRRMSATALSPADAAQRLDLLADRRRQARQADVAPASRAWPCRSSRHAAGSRPRRAGWRTSGARPPTTGSTASWPDQRLAQDAGEEARGRQVGLARADADGRQPDADAVEEAAPRIVATAAARRSPSACRSWSAAS